MFEKFCNHAAMMVLGVFVGALIFRITRMALDPVPIYVMALVGRFQALPQFHILDRFPAGGAPAIFLPFGNPAGDTVAQIV